MHSCFFEALIICLLVNFSRRDLLVAQSTCFYVSPKTHTTLGAAFHPALSMSRLARANWSSEVELVLGTAMHQLYALVALAICFWVPASQKRHLVISTKA